MRIISFLTKRFVLILTYSFIIFRKMLEACFVSYETNMLDRQGFEITDEPVWMLGREYNTKTNLSDLNADVKSRFWFTYRRNFPSIGDSGMTSDRGWGCMLRCGQMVMAQALVNHHIGRDPFWPLQEDKPKITSSYKKILGLFQDKKSSAYSIHKLAQMGVSEGKEIGQWFGPNTVAQVLKKLSVYEEWSSIKIHVAMDNTVAIDEIEQLCQTEDSESKSTWNHLLLVIPLRLGLLSINPIYIDDLKTCLQMPESVGMIGGKPSQALYFIGYAGDDVVFLDPHITQNFIDLDEEPFEDSTYHPETCSRISFQSMDPSLALCFSCSTRLEWQCLLKRLQAMTETNKKQNLFEVCNQRQTEWFPSSSNTELMDEAIALGTFHSGDSEEEFEILG